MQETWVRSLMGKIPHALEQLSPCVTTIEIVLLSLGAATTEALMPGACAQQQEKSSHCSQRAVPTLDNYRKSEQQQRPSTAKNKHFLKMLISAVQQNESVTHVHLSTFFKILFLYRSLQSIEYSSLCYTLSPYQFSIYSSVYISSPISQFIPLS